MRSWLQQRKYLSERGDESPTNNTTDQLIKARTLLACALEEKLENCLERIFRLLGLKYPPERHVERISRPDESEKAALRANSIEFLDNLLEVSLKRSLIPIVESSRPVALKKRSLLQEISLPDEDESIELILSGDDSWLKTCTIYLLALDGNRRFEKAIRTLETTRDPLVHETATLYIRRLELQSQDLD